MSEDKTVRMTENEYVEMTCGMGHPGFCVACGYLDEYTNCEPDAHEYECPECGEMKLMGLEWALTCGLVEIAEDYPAPKASSQ